MMTINRTEDEAETTWRLGVNELEQISEYKYISRGMDVSEWVWEIK